METYEYYERYDFYSLVGDRIDEFAVKKNYPHGSTLYNEGEEPKGLYFIKTGLVGLIHISPNGTESLLRVFSPCTFMGHRSFLAKEPYHASAIALKDTEVYFIDLKKADELLELKHELMCHFVKVMAKDLKRAENRLRDMSGKKVMGRIIESLLYLKHRHPNYHWTRREIGEFCGAKTETVSRVLGQLEKAGLIEKSGREILLLNEDGLLAEAEKEKEREK